MKNRLNFVSGIGLGLGVMYYIDPVLGHRRRIVARDRMVHGVHEVGNSVDLVSRDLRNRTKGVISNARQLLSDEKPDDTILVERVRAKMGRAVSHPHAIEVHAEQGRVTLTGMILKHEVDQLVSHISSVRGVEEIINQLKTYKSADRVPELQGGRVRRGDRFELFQTRWSPSARFLVGLVSAGSLVYGLGRRDRVGALMGGVSLGFLIRALTNFEIRRILGMRGSRTIHVHKTLHIDRPIEQVFEFLSQLQNFQKVMPDVVELREIGNKRHHWKVTGPAGIPIEWNSVVTRYEAQKRIAWKSEPGGLVQNAGQMHFIPQSDHSTKIEIDLYYNPVIGALGHVFAKLFGADPKSKMDEDLMRVKTILESGPSERQKLRKV